MDYRLYVFLHTTRFMDLQVKFNPRKINLEPRDLFQISNLADGEIVNDPHGRHKPGSPFVINHGDINSKKFPNAIFPAPNPIEFYLHSVVQSLDEIVLLETVVHQDIRQINALIYEQIRFCIFAVCALEAFVNQMIPTTFTYTGKDKTESKQDIEKSWSLEDKFKKIIPKISGVRITGDSKKWQTLTELIALRNNLIHLKTTYPNVSDFRSYQDLYQQLLDTDYRGTFSVVKYVISLIASSKPEDTI